MKYAHVSTTQSSHGSAAVFVYAVLALWGTTALTLSVNGAYDATWGILPVAIIGGIGIPVLVFGIAYRISPGLRKFVLALDIRPIILLHAWRMLGLGFVYLYFYDVLPGWFALPAGLGDAATATAALAIGISLYSSRPVSRATVLIWNTLGFLDFVLAVSMGIITRPGMENVNDGPTSAPMGEFPLALIPAFAVPFFILTHIIIFVKLGRAHTADG